MAEHSPHDVAVPSNDHLQEDPIIVSGNRFWDIAPYTSMLYQSDPHRWGSILPWEFPQSASKQEEEAFILQEFGEREVHLQGGTTGGGAGYKFLKQVWYSISIANAHLRVPQIADWWWKHERNQEVVTDPKMWTCIMEPSARVDTFFLEEDKAMFGEKILVWVVKHIQQIAQACQEEKEKQAKKSKRQQKQNKQKSTTKQDTAKETNSTTIKNEASPMSSTAVVVKCAEKVVTASELSHTPQAEDTSLPKLDKQKTSATPAIDQSMLMATGTSKAVHQEIGHVSSEGQASQQSGRIQHKSGIQVPKLEDTSEQTTSSLHRPAASSSSYTNNTTMSRRSSQGLPPIVTALPKHLQEHWRANREVFIPQQHLSSHQAREHLFNTDSTTKEQPVHGQSLSTQQEMYNHQDAEDPHSGYVRRRASAYHQGVRNTSSFNHASGDELVLSNTTHGQGTPQTPQQDDQRRFSATQSHQLSMHHRGVLHHQPALNTAQASMEHNLPPQYAAVHNSADAVGKHYIGSHRHEVTQLVILGLPVGISEEEVYKHFMEHGISRVRIMKPHHSVHQDPTKPGIMFATFFSHIEARDGLAMHRTQLHGREIGVEVSRVYWDPTHRRFDQNHVDRAKTDDLKHFSGQRSGSFHHTPHSYNSAGSLRRGSTASSSYYKNDAASMSEHVRPTRQFSQDARNFPLPDLHNHVTVESSKPSFNSPNKKGKWKPKKYKGIEFADQSRINFNDKTNQDADPTTLEFSTNTNNDGVKNQSGQKKIQKHKKEDRAAVDANKTQDFQLQNSTGDVRVVRAPTKTPIDAKTLNISKHKPAISLGHLASHEFEQDSPAHADSKKDKISAANTKLLVMLNNSNKPSETAVSSGKDSVRPVKDLEVISATALSNKACVVVNTPSKILAVCKPSSTGSTIIATTNHTQIEPDKLTSPCLRSAKSSNRKGESGLQVSEQDLTKTTIYQSQEDHDSLQLSTHIDTGTETVSSQTSDEPDISIKTSTSQRHDSTPKKDHPNNLEDVNVTAGKASEETIPPTPASVYTTAPPTPIVTDITDKQKDKLADKSKGPSYTESLSMFGKKSKASKKKKDSKKDTIKGKPKELAQTFDKVIDTSMSKVAGKGKRKTGQSKQSVTSEQQPESSVATSAVTSTTSPSKPKGTLSNLLGMLTRQVTGLTGSQATSASVVSRELQQSSVEAVQDNSEPGAESLDPAQDSVKAGAECTDPALDDIKIDLECSRPISLVSKRTDGKQDDIKGGLECTAQTQDVTEIDTESFETPSADTEIDREVYEGLVEKQEAVTTMSSFPTTYDRRQEASDMTSPKLRREDSVRQTSTNQDLLLEDSTKPPFRAESLDQTPEKIGSQDITVSPSITASTSSQDNGEITPPGSDETSTRNRLFAASAFSNDIETQVSGYQAEQSNDDIASTSQAPLSTLTKTAAKKKRQARAGKRLTSNSDYHSNTQESLLSTRSDTSPEAVTSQIVTPQSMVKQERDLDDRSDSSHTLSAASSTGSTTTKSPARLLEQLWPREPQHLVEAPPARNARIRRRARASIEEPDAGESEITSDGVSLNTSNQQAISLMQIVTETLQNNERTTGVTEYRPAVLSSNGFLYLLCNNEQLPVPSEEQKVVEVEETGVIESQRDEKQQPITEIEEVDCSEDNMSIERPDQDDAAGINDEKAQAGGLKLDGGNASKLEPKDSAVTTKDEKIVGQESTSTNLDASFRADVHNAADTNRVVDSPEAEHQAPRTRQSMKSRQTSTADKPYG